jgi:hypothetical protein
MKAQVRKFVLLTMLAIAAAGCNRWVPTESPTIPLTSSADEGYERVISWLRSNGYDIDRQDDERHFVRVKAKLDGDMAVPMAAPFMAPKIVNRTSFFGFQVDDTGKLTVTPSGYHVRPEDGVMHKDLKAELDLILESLR